MSRVSFYNLFNNCYQRSVGRKFLSLLPCLVLALSFLGLVPVQSGANEGVQSQKSLKMESSYDLSIDGSIVRFTVEGSLFDDVHTVNLNGSNLNVSEDGFVRLNQAFQGRYVVEVYPYINAAGELYERKVLIRLNTISNSAIASRWIRQSSVDGVWGLTVRNSIRASAESFRSDTRASADTIKESVSGRIYPQAINLDKARVSEVYLTFMNTGEGYVLVNVE